MPRRRSAGAALSCCIGRAGLPRKYSSPPASIRSFRLRTTWRVLARHSSSRKLRQAAADPVQPTAIFVAVRMSTQPPAQPALRAKISELDRLHHWLETLCELHQLPARLAFQLDLCL